MGPAGASPSSSPRLPSPPPFTEIQIGPLGPQSPVADGFLAADAEANKEADASIRRIRPGTKALDMASGPPLIPLAQLDSPFQLQEHLKALYQNYTRPSGSDTVTPITRAIAKQLAESPEGVERSLWLYELCRFLTMKANNLVIAFFAEKPPCSAQTCPEMRASEWQYLCAVHDPPKPCCAIDYCCHTLDWATNILTSPKYFPSRLTLGSESGGGPQASMRHLTNIFRRVYRIFAHAWFQHRDVFWQVEGNDGLYVFFKTVCDVYSLIPEDGYTIPAEAEGEEPPTAIEADSRRMTILRKEDKGGHELKPGTGAIDQSSLSPGATTRRHRHSPSTGLSVTTISEVGEDDEVPKDPGNISVLVTPAEEPKEAEGQDDDSKTIHAAPSGDTGAEGKLGEEERDENDKTPPSSDNPSAEKDPGEEPEKEAKEGPVEEQKPAEEAAAEKVAEKAEEEKDTEDKPTETESPKETPEHPAAETEPTKADSLQPPPEEATKEQAASEDPASPSAKPDPEPEKSSESQPEEGEKESEKEENKPESEATTTTSASSTNP